MFRKALFWLLVALVVVYVVTGFGITEFRTVESLTQGILTKNLSFRIHNNLLLFIVSIAVVVAHAYLGLRARNSRRRDQDKTD